MPASSTLGIPIAVGAVSIAVTALAWTVAVRAAEAQDFRRFENAVEIAQASINDRITVQIRLLRATKGLVVNTPDLNRGKWIDFGRSIDIPSNYRGLTGLGWSQVIPPGGVRGLEQNMRLQGDRNFKVFGPENPLNARHAILYLAPDNVRNRRALGFDMSSDPERREAMQQAALSGKEAATKGLRLVQEGGDEPQIGFLIYLPVYDTPVTPPQEERLAKLRGFVYSPFRGGDLLASILGQHSNSNLRVYVSQEVAPGQHVEIFDDPRPRAQHALSATQELTVAGQRWDLVYHSTPFFERNSAGRFLWWIPVVGVLVTGLLTSLTWRQSQITRKLHEHAEALRQREFHQSLLARAGKLLNESLDYNVTLDSVAQSIVPRFADWCAVDVATETGYSRLAVAHVNPAKARWAKEIQSRYPPDLDAPAGVPNVIRTGQPELYKTIPEEMLLASARDEEHKRLILEIGFTSAMIVPIKSRDRVLGTITFVWAESKQHYDEEDLNYAQEIADRAGIAMDNSMLFQESERRRHELSQFNDHLEELVAARTAELQLTNQELEAFAYSVSHDLRAPLRSVDGFSRMLLDDFGDVLDSDGKEAVDRIRKATKRMDELISALLSLSRITRSNVVRREVDVSEAAEVASNHAKGMFGEHVEVAIQPGMVANADEFLLNAVMENLIGNAVKFSTKAEHPRVEVGCERNVFFVKDNGIGFNPEYKNKLFAPFERLHSAKEFTGSGIGLATVQRIIQRHGGRIWAESDEGKGAAFYFTLHP